VNAGVDIVRALLNARADINFVENVSDDSVDLGTVLHLLADRSSAYDSSASRIEIAKLLLPVLNVSSDLKMMWWLCLRAYHHCTIDAPIHGISFSFV